MRKVDFSALVCYNSRCAENQLSARKTWYERFFLFPVLLIVRRVFVVLRAESWSSAYLKFCRSSAGKLTTPKLFSTSKIIWMYFQTDIWTKNKQKSAFRNSRGRFWGIITFKSSFFHPYFVKKILCCFKIHISNENEQKFVVCSIPTYRGRFSCIIIINYSFFCRSFSKIS